MERNDRSENHSHPAFITPGSIWLS